MAARLPALLLLGSPPPPCATNTGHDSAVRYCAAAWWCCQQRVPATKLSARLTPTRTRWREPSIEAAACSVLAGPAALCSYCWMQQLHGQGCTLFDAHSIKPTSCPRTEAKARLFLATAERVSGRLQSGSASMDLTTSKKSIRRNCIKALVCSCWRAELGCWAVTCYSHSCRSCGTAGFQPSVKSSSSTSSKSDS